MSMFENYFALMYETIRLYWLDYRMKEIVPFLYFGLWVLILCTPLFGIDRRDNIAGLVYVLFCIASGVTLVLVLPKENYGIPPLSQQIFYVTLMGVIATYRWYFHGDRNKIAIKEERRKNG